MKTRTGTTLAAAALVLAAAAVAGLPVLARPPVDFDPSCVTWCELVYRASKLGFSTTSKVTLDALPSGQAAAGFIDAGEYTGLAPHGPELLRLRIISSLLGRETTSTLWFDPVRAEAYQAIQHTTGKRHRYRAYRFAEQGVYSLLRKPGDGQEGLAPERWANGSDQAFPHPPWAGSDLLVASPSALFYILSVAGLSRPGDHVELPVFSRTDVSLMKIRVAKTERVRVDYTLSGSGQDERRVRDRVAALHLSLSAQPLDERSASDFQLMGLEGDVEILLDPEYRVPLEIEGRVPRAGKVTIRLQRLVLRQAGRGARSVE